MDPDQVAGYAFAQVIRYRKSYFFIVGLVRIVNENLHTLTNTYVLQSLRPKSISLPHAPIFLLQVATSK